MAIAAILVFFPVLVNTLRGLTSVRPQSIELMRSYAAGEVEIFRRVRLPNSLPYLFAALKVATVLAMIGAIVGEYFLSSQEALGFQIRELGRALPVRARLGCDRRCERARNPVLLGGRARRAADHELASIVEIGLTVDRLSREQPKEREDVT